MELYGTLWNSMELYGTLWNSIQLFKKNWAYIEPGMGKFRLFYPKFLYIFGFYWREGTFFYWKWDFGFFEFFRVLSWKKLNFYSVRVPDPKKVELKNVWVELTRPDRVGFQLGSLFGSGPWMQTLVFRVNTKNHWLLSISDLFWKNTGSYSNFWRSNWSKTLRESPNW